MPSTLAERLEAHARLAQRGPMQAAAAAGWPRADEDESSGQAGHAPHALPPPREDIVSSWARCSGLGLDLSRPPAIEVVSGAELGRRREAVDFVRRLALAELETLQQQIAGSNFLLAFADREGVILDLYADQRFTMSGQGDDILLGSRWTEASRGTNGLGTALATGRAVAVTGAEHYFLDLRHVSCTAAPVRDAHGQIVGVLDASSYFESRQRHTQALVHMAASQIENRLLVHQMREHWILAIHPRTEFLGTLSAGLLAFDGLGRLCAANERARALLTGLELDGLTRFEELFREPFEHVLGRLHRQPQGRELQLVDALGSVLHARCLAALTGNLAVTRGVLLAGNSPGSRTEQRIGMMRAEAGRVTPSMPSARSTSPAPQAPPLPRGTASAALAKPASVARHSSSPPAHLAAYVIDDPQVRRALDTTSAAVRLHAPVLIQGESGSGKEMLARHAHVMSGRKGEFVAVNCAALPEELFEAELFGYVGGAYTGARREGDPGLIVSADQGTLLLDEIRELSPTAQGALLRFLDDQQVRPVGGHQLRKVDVQLLAATHADLAGEVTVGRFRADLYYRLAGVAVRLPPLRERSDFEAIVRHVLHGLAPEVSLSRSALARLREAPWAGNFRELRAVLTRALLMAQLSDDSTVFHVEHVDQALAELARPAPPSPRRRLSAAPKTRSTRSADTRPQVLVHPRAQPSSAGLSSSGTSADHTITLGASALQAHATTLVLAEYERTGGSVSQTSRNLGISRTTVYRHLRAGGQLVSDQPG